MNSNSFLQCSQGVTCWIWFPSVLQRFLEKQQPRTASWEVCRKQTGWRVKFQLPQRNLCPKNQFLQLHFLGFLWLLWRILRSSFPTPQCTHFIPSAKAPEILGLGWLRLEQKISWETLSQHSFLLEFPSAALKWPPELSSSLFTSDTSQFAHT